MLAPRQRVDRHEPHELPPKRQIMRLTSPEQPENVALPHQQTFASARLRVLYMPRAPGSASCSGSPIAESSHLLKAVAFFVHPRLSRMIPVGATLPSRPQLALSSAAATSRLALPGPNLRLGALQATSPFEIFMLRITFLLH